MQIHGAVKAVLDLMQDANTNPAYPGFDARTAYDQFIRLAPLIPGLASGTVTGTGAAIKIGADDADEVNDIVDPALEFTPSLVIVANETTGCIWASILSAAGKGWKIKAGDDSIAFVASDAITLGTRQFTLGVDADLNAEDDVIRYVAIGR